MSGSGARLALVLTGALLLGAERVGALSWIVPGIANSPGVNGSYFSSDLTVVNAGSADRTVTLSLLPGPGTPKQPPRAYTIPAGSTLRLGNVLGAVWSVNGTGALRVAADGPVSLFARTYNVPPVVVIPEVPFPSFSASLPVIEEGSLLAPGEAGHSPWVTQSADPGKGDRTNVAVVFSDDAGGAAIVSLFDEIGAVVRSISYDSAVPAALQQSLTAFTTADVPAGRITVTVTRGRACGYTATADNGTGDLTVFPTDRQAAAAGGRFSAVSSGVAQTPGLQGAFWQTEARLANVSGATVTVTAFLLGVSGQIPRGDFMVPPGRTVAIRSLLTSLFNFTGAASGSVLWIATGPLLVGTRTSSVVSLSFAAGTVGAGASAVPLDAFLRPGDGPADLGDLRSGAFSRTNLLIAAGPAGATCALEARSEDGRSIGIVRQALSVLGFAELRLSDLFPSPGPMDRVRLRVSVESGSANVQAAVVDSSTNDFVVYEASPRGNAAPPPTPPLSPGLWGAPDGSEGLNVDARRILVERLCQSGTFPQPLGLDARGRFAVIGDYLVNIGPAAGFAAILSGQTDGQAATISVLRLDGTATGAPRTYVLGKPYTIAPAPCPIEY